MHFDIMTRADSWENIAALARDVEGAGASGILFTEASQVPWMTSQHRHLRRFSAQPDGIGADCLGAGGQYQG